MEPVVVISLIVGVIVLLLIIGAPLKSMNIIGQGIVKLLIGAILLFFLNVFGNQFGLQIPINFVTSAVSGLLGLPGVATLVAIKLYVL